MKAKGRWPAIRDALRGASLQQKMTAMLMAIILLSMLFTGAVVAIGSLYLRQFNNIMDDCYGINRLLGALRGELDAFDAYVLVGGEAAYGDYLTARGQTTQALSLVSLPFDESREQYLLLQAVQTTLPSLREACDETVYKRVAGQGYAAQYERVLGAGQYIEGYVRELLQLAINEGQQVYSRNTARFRALPLLFVLGVVLSFLGIMLWTRWTVRHVVTPINDLTRAAGAMREHQYDAPDVMTYQEGEIAQLARVVNEMKHSTARLLDSLRAQSEMENRLHAEEMQRVRMEATMDTLRLSLLQSQINPHFLFNTLNIISRMAQIEGAKTTEELIVRLANLFRYNLQGADGIVPLERELRIAEDYIAIQKIRFGDRIAFDLRCDIDPAGIHIPVFTMQPLIENAVIHGISPMEDGGGVSVNVRREGALLYITVADTGVGIAPELLERLLTNEPAAGRHVSGLGLGNVRARIAAHFPGSGFAVDSAPGAGTSIRITIPWEEDTAHV